VSGSAGLTEKLVVSGPTRALPRYSTSQISQAMMDAMPSASTVAEEEQLKIAANCVA
jgi:hypothetical protein